MLENAVAVTAGKGGVLKTTLSCHLAAVAASGGWRVLMVDADPQGNSMFDLGYPSDAGAGLAAALIEGRPLEPLEGVRPNLDAICGGPALDAAADASRMGTATSTLEHALRGLACEYDLVVIDSPARELWLRRMILTAAHFVIVPSGIDRASRVGLPDAAATITEIRLTTNPDLDVLAVTAGPINSSSTRIRERAKRRLGELIGDHDLVCTTIVRHASLVAEHCREHGLLAHEYASLRTSNPARLGEYSLDRSEISDAAAGVAEDWANLTAELLARYCAATHPAAAAGRSTVSVPTSPSLP